MYVCASSARPMLYSRHAQQSAMDKNSAGSGTKGMFSGVTANTRVDMI